eukprot:358277-Chlamydomonas_euryale.AAC.5
MAADGAPQPSDAAAAFARGAEAAEAAAAGSSSATPRAWLVGLASVLFDVDVGPKVEALVPPGCLSAEERQAVAFHAFPVSYVDGGRRIRAG